jgi:hypothetical protein
MMKLLVDAFWVFFSNVSILLHSSFYPAKCTNLNTIKQIIKHYKNSVNVFTVPTARWQSKLKKKRIRRDIRKCVKFY